MKRLGTPGGGRCAFTLVELLVVVVIIGMLVGLLVPAVISSRNRARQVQCVNRLGELGKAMASYANSKQYYPGTLNYFTGASYQNGTTFSWPIVLFEHLGRSDVWEAWRGGTRVPIQVNELVCPADSEVLNYPCPLSYVVNRNVCRDLSNSNPAQRRARQISPERIKSPARTVLISERTAIDPISPNALDVGPWNIMDNPGVPVPSGRTAPDQLGFWWRAPGETDQQYATKTIGYTTAARYIPLRSNHPGGVVATFCDGHTELLPVAMLLDEQGRDMSLCSYWDCGPIPEPNAQ